MSWLHAFAPPLLFGGEKLRYPGLIFPSQLLFQSISSTLKILSTLFMSVLIFCPCLLEQTTDQVFILTDPVEVICHCETQFQSKIN